MSTTSKAERIAAKLTEGIMTGHDHPNLQHELDRMNAAAHLRALEANRQMLVEALSRLEVAANTVAYCYEKYPANFAVALSEMKDDAEAARTTLEQAKELE